MMKHLLRRVLHLSDTCIRPAPAPDCARARAFLARACVAERTLADRLTAAGVHAADARRLLETAARFMAAFEIECLPEPVLTEVVVCFEAALRTGLFSQLTVAQCAAVAAWAAASRMPERESPAEPSVKNRLRTARRLCALLPRPARELFDALSESSRRGSISRLLRTPLPHAQAPLTAIVTRCAPDRALHPTFDLMRVLASLPRENLLRLFRFDCRLIGSTHAPEMFLKRLISAKARTYLVARPLQKALQYNAEKLSDNAAAVVAALLRELPALPPFLGRVVLLDPWAQPTAHVSCEALRLDTRFALELLQLAGVVPKGTETAPNAPQNALGLPLFATLAVRAAGESCGTIELTVFERTVRLPDFPNFLARSLQSAFAEIEAEVAANPSRRNDFLICTRADDDPAFVVESLFVPLALLAGASELIAHELECAGLLVAPSIVFRPGFIPRSTSDSGKTACKEAFNALSETRRLHRTGDVPSPPSSESAERRQARKARTVRRVDGLGKNACEGLLIALFDTERLSHRFLMRRQIEELARGERSHSVRRAEAFAARVLRQTPELCEPVIKEHMQPIFAGTCTETELEELKKTQLFDFIESSVLLRRRLAGVGWDAGEEFAALSQEIRRARAPFLGAAHRKPWFLTPGQGAAPTLKPQDKELFASSQKAFGSAS